MYIYCIMAKLLNCGPEAKKFESQTTFYVHQSKKMKYSISPALT